MSLSILDFRFWILDFRKAASSGTFVKSPFLVGPLITKDIVDSTQDEAIRLLQLGSPAGVVRAIHQTKGRGRFHRKWESEPGSSLTVSFLFELESSQTEPWLYGMALACAVATTFQIQVQWPNDLVIENRKVGGILTEITSNSAGTRFAVIGLGFNLSNSDVPSGLGETACGLESHIGSIISPSEALEAVLNSIGRIPEPTTWKDIEGVWSKLDSTPGKVYKSPEGRVGIAKGIGNQGELIAEFGGKLEPVFAADAYFGSSES